MISHRGPMLKCNISTTEIISVPSNVSEIKQMSLAECAWLVRTYVIVKLLRPLPGKILFHFQDETTC